jgi:hypothetical protein
MSEIETIRRAFRYLSATSPELQALDALAARLEAAEQALEAFALCTDELEAAGFHVLAALARQPSRESA